MSPFIEQIINVCDMALENGGATLTFKTAAEAIRWRSVANTWRGRQRRENGLFKYDELSFVIDRSEPTRLAVVVGPPVTFKVEFGAPQ